jgi:hypothetical protein
MRIMASPPPPTTERIRLTISVTPETHAIFVSMAEASGQSLGRCIGDWLEDTAEGAQFVAKKMVEARAAPKTVMREMHSFAQGLLSEVAQAQENMRLGAGAAALPGRLAPPSSNTGGKVPRTSPRKPRP